MGNYQGRNRQNSQQLDISNSNEFELSAGEEDSCLKKVNKHKTTNDKKIVSGGGDWNYVIDNDDSEFNGEIGAGVGSGDGGEEKEAFFGDKRNSQSDDDYHTTEDDEQQSKNNGGGDSMRNLIDVPLLAIDADDVDDIDGSSGGVYMNRNVCNDNKHSSTETVASSTSETRSSSSPSSSLSNNEQLSDDIVKYEMNGVSRGGDREKLKLLGSKLNEVNARALLHSTSDTVLTPIPPPPCTPVSGGSLSISSGMNQNGGSSSRVMTEQISQPAPIAYRNQQLIEDVILLDECDRGLVPLAQQEEHSFNSLDSSNNSHLNNGVNPQPQPPSQQNVTENIEFLLEKLNINGSNDTNTKPLSSAQVEERVEDEKVVNNHPLAKLLSQLAETNLICHHFEYITNGIETVTDIKLTGSFNNWSEFLPLQKDLINENKWFRDIYLAPGEYEYKYKVNDEWRCDDKSEIRGINNYLNLIKQL